MTEVDDMRTGHERFLDKQRNEGRKRVLAHVEATLGMRRSIADRLCSNNTIIVPSIKGTKESLLAERDWFQEQVNQWDSPAKCEVVVEGGDLRFKLIQETKTNG